MTAGGYITFWLLRMHLLMMHSVIIVFIYVLYIYEFLRSFRCDLKYKLRLLRSCSALGSPLEASEPAPRLGLSCSVSPSGSSEGVAVDRQG